MSFSLCMYVISLYVYLGLFPLAYLEIFSGEESLDFNFEQYVRVYFFL